MSVRDDSVAAFGWWCLAGTGFAVGVLALFTVGPFLLLASYALSGVLLWRVGFGWAMAGLLSGAAVPMLWVAWANRHGPGTSCTSTALSTRCTEEWSPWPWLVLAVALVAVSVVVFVRGRRGRSG